MDASRHKADNLESYRLYYNLIKSKIKEKGVRTEDTYNIDEKGFILGVLNKSRRVFTKDAFQRKRVLANT